MGCMRRLGCLVLLVVLAIVAYLTRDSWMHFLPGVGPRSTADTGVAGTTLVWQPVTADGAARARKALEQLRAPRGPAYVNIAAGDLGSYIYQELAKSLPQSAQGIETAGLGDRLYVRATVNTTELKAGLGPLAGLLGEREQIQMGGTLHVIRPGIAELQIKDMKIGNVALPQALIPRLVRQISRGVRPPELAPDGIPLQTPEYIGDVRVSNNRVTLYKVIPAR